MTIHPPVVAGTFYPAGADALHRQVATLLGRAPALDVPPPKAVILPHAGYRFSGAVAAAGAVVLTPGVRRIVVLGPSHHHAFQGVALPDADAMATPLGPIPIDADARATLLTDPDITVMPEAFAREHSIEVELPFLQARLGDFTLVPLVVGQVRTDALDRILTTLWGGAETLIVISTDLTHFLTGPEAERVDTATARAIETARTAALTAREACGHRPLAAFLTVAARHGLRLTRLALTHSGAVTGDAARVVGYGAWMAHDPETARLAPAHRATALRTARQALTLRARRGTAPKIALASFPAPMQGMAPAFVTLTRDKRLRGCVGSLKSQRPLAEDILANSLKAGFDDPRFRPVTEQELPGTALEIAILSAPARLRFESEDDLIAQLRPGRDGLILQSKDRRGTFLPKVWDSLATPDAFLNGLKVKAGLPRDHWSGDVKIWRYVTESFSDTA